MGGVDAQGEGRSVGDTLWSGERVEERNRCWSEGRSGGEQKPMTHENVQTLVECLVKTFECPLTTPIYKSIPLLAHFVVVMFPWMNKI